MKKFKNFFTLVELIVAMGVFVLLMLVLVQFMTAAQKIWSEFGKKTQMFEDARIALDMITRDLQGVLYNEQNSSKGIYPFWHEADDRLNFISATSIGSSKDFPADNQEMAKIREIKWARTDTNPASGNRDIGVSKADHPINTGTNLRPGLLVRAVTGDYLGESDSTARQRNNNLYNFIHIPKNSTNPHRVYCIWKAYQGTGSNNTPANADYSGSPKDNKSTGGSGFQQVIPNVVALKFTCYNKQGQDMTDKDGDGTPFETAPGGADCDYHYNSTQTATSTPLPYMVQVELTLLDKQSWDKWIALGGNPNNPNADPVVAREFREKNQRTFSKMIFIGERESQ